MEDGGWIYKTKKNYMLSADLANLLKVSSFHSGISSDTEFFVINRT